MKKLVVLLMMCLSFVFVSAVDLSKERKIMAEYGIDLGNMEEAVTICYIFNISELRPQFEKNIKKAEGIYRKKFSKDEKKFHIVEGIGYSGVYDILTNLCTSPEIKPKHNQIQLANELDKAEKLATAKGGDTISVELLLAIAKVITFEFATVSEKIDGEFK